MSIDLDELERLANAAPPGPWIAGSGDMVLGKNGWEVEAGSREAALFIAACRVAMPELIRRLRDAEDTRALTIREILIAGEPSERNEVDQWEEWGRTRVSGLEETIAQVVIKKSYEKFTPSDWKKCVEMWKEECQRLLSMLVEAQKNNDRVTKANQMLACREHDPEFHAFRKIVIAASTGDQDKIATSLEAGKVWIPK